MVTNPSIFPANRFGTAFPNRAQQQQRVVAQNTAPQSFAPQTATSFGFQPPNIQQLIQQLIQIFGFLPPGLFPPAPQPPRPPIGPQPPGPITNGDIGVNLGRARPIQLTQNDFIDYLLAGSQGGRTGTSEFIDGRYSNPNGRLANSGANEFDAAIAHMYYTQFKGVAFGVNGVFIPGVNDNIGQIAGQLAQVQNARLTPEADLLAKVAATYRGDLGGGSGAYDNGALGYVISEVWGRRDLITEGVGQFDVQTVGAAVTALNQEQDPRRRQQMLQAIFDFQGNSPNSPFGAVPAQNAGQYQQAITMVTNGHLDGLLHNYQSGVRTYDSNAPVRSDQPIPQFYNNGQAIDYRQLTPEQRSEIGLTDADRAILHMWGRQMISDGYNDGSVYRTFLGGDVLLDDNGQPVINPQTGQPVISTGGTEEEKRLIQQFVDYEVANYGEVNGEALNLAFFDLFRRMTGEDISQRYAGRRTFSYDGQGISDAAGVQFLEQSTAQSRAAVGLGGGGINKMEQAILRLWGHEPLFTGGEINGSILAYTIGNAASLDGGQAVANIDDMAMQLLQADFASDGVLNGDSLATNFISVMDKLYGVGPGANSQTVQQNAIGRAQQLGRSFQQINDSVNRGVRLAIDNVQTFVREHPVAAVAGTAGIAGATAICPFLGGLGVAGAAMALSQSGGQAPQLIQQGAQGAQPIF